MFPPKPAPVVELINLTSGYVLFSGGMVLPITAYIGADGNDCDRGDAIVCVAGSDEHGWFTISVGEGETLH